MDPAAYAGHPLQSTETGAAADRVEPAQLTRRAAKFSAYNLQDDEQAELDLEEEIVQLSLQVVAKTLRLQDIRRCKNRTAAKTQQRQQQTGADRFSNSLSAAKAIPAERILPKDLAQGQRAHLEQALGNLGVDTSALVQQVNEHSRAVLPHATVTGSQHLQMPVGGASIQGPVRHLEEASLQAIGKPMHQVQPSAAINTHREVIAHSVATLKRPHAVDSHEQEQERRREQQRREQQQRRMVQQHSQHAQPVHAPGTMLQKITAVIAAQQPSKRKPHIVAVLTHLASGTHSKPPFSACYEDILPVAVRAAPKWKHVVNMLVQDLENTHLVTVIRKQEAGSVKGQLILQLDTEKVQTLFAEVSQAARG